jgi:DNA polymerase-3 subunit delta'
MDSNWGILGHEWAVDMLKQHLLHGRLRHAYLFTGPPGLGRRTLALRFAQAMNCPTPVAPGEPCRECKTCRQIEAMTYPDLTVVKSETEGGVLKVEQIRQVQHSLSLKPYQGMYRVALFLRFQEANPNAQNALLKTLEEAPSYVVLLLTADSAEQLFPTIVSRCEVLRLRPLAQERVESYLTAQGADPATSHLLAAICGGRPGYARALMDEPKALDFRRERLDDLPRLLRGTRRERFAYAEALAKDKEAFRNVLLLWLVYWRDVLLRVAGSEAPIVNVDRAEEIKERAGHLSLPEAHRLVADLEGALERLEKNVNSRLLAEVLLLDWPRG